MISITDEVGKYLKAWEEATIDWDLGEEEENPEDRGQREAEVRLKKM
jgi:hypothetical protein